MKAMIQTRYGAPDVLQLQSAPKPTPKADEVLVKVHVATVGPADVAFRKGEPFIVRLLYGLAKPRLAIGGVEFGGEIEAVGEAVTLFKPGDQVYGMSVDKFGAHAEYLCVPEKKVIAAKSPQMSYQEAVAVCDGTTTALTFLRDKAKVQSGQKVLINGASGSVGGYAVQLAKYYGAEVTGVCSTANVEQVKALGADAVIDYTQQDFTQNTGQYDVIFDAVGKSSFAKCKNALTPNGVYLTTVPTFAMVRDVLGTALFGSKKAKFATAGLMQNKENLNFITTLFEAGKIKAYIDRCYPLEELAEAHRYVETERKRGNVLVIVAE